MSFKDFLKENENEEKIYDPSTEVCPTCGGEIKMYCRCMIGNKVCENGHSWHIKDGFVIEGSGHGDDIGKKLMRSK